MSLFEWNQDYSVGIEQFDNEHKKLIDMINELHDAMLAREAKEKCEDIIKRMSDYTIFHFANEEKIFEKYNYDEIAEHKIKHKEFVQKVLDFKKDFENGGIFLSVKIMDFLKDWLLNHINVVDKKYGPYLISKGIK